jgi:SH3-like domain-containing protein
MISFIDENNWRRDVSGQADWGRAIRCVGTASAIVGTWLNAKIAAVRMATYCRDGGKIRMFEYSPSLVSKKGQSPTSPQLVNGRLQH